MTTFILPRIEATRACLEVETSVAKINTDYRHIEPKRLRRQNLSLEIKMTALGGFFPLFLKGEVRGDRRKARENLLISPFLQK